MVAEAWAEIQALGDGAHYCKVDLHVHTPASHDYADKRAAHGDLIKKARAVDLDMIAVTDHHTAQGVDPMRDAAKGTGVLVLPGVEVSASGIHILAIFAEDTPAAKIDDYLLPRLGVKPDERDRPETTASMELSVPKVLQEIMEAGGIAVAAHTDSDKGLTSTFRGQARIDLVRDLRLGVVEITKAETTKYLDGTDPNYKRELTCIQSSVRSGPGSARPHPLPASAGCG